MNALGLITARGGSKRIPRKNIRPFLGKPIMAYVIEAALRSECFEEVIVSTDDDEIAAVAESYDATVPFRRSANNSGDEATTADVVLEVLSEYQKKGRSFESICVLYPTAPFVTAEKIKEGAKRLHDHQADAVIPVTRFEYPVERAFRNERGRLKWMWPENETKRSQDLEPAYHDAGQFYWLRTAVFLKEKKILMAKSVPMELSRLETQDIDDELDWALAELKFQKWLGSKDR